MTPLLAASIAWLAGAGAGLLAPLNATPLLAAVLIAIVSAWLLRRRVRLRPLAMLLALALLGAWRAEAHQESQASDPLAGVRGAAALRGVVAQEPDTSDASLRWRLKVEAWRPPDGEWTPVESNVLVWSRHVPAVHYGDTVELTGSLEPAPTFDRFDYAAYLARQGVHRVVRYPKVALLGTGGGHPVIAAALSARRALSEALDRQLPEPQNALAKGILLGIRSGMPQELLEDFRRTGTTHILAISGHNMAVVAGMLSFLLGRRLSRRSWRFVVLASAALAAYSLLVGLPPSVARAALMAALAFVAGAAGRETYPVGGLAFAAVLMTAIDPTLLQDAGFQLSFGAMWGILAFAPGLHHRMANWLGASTTQWGTRAKRALAEGGAATLAATLGTLPIQAFTFGQVTLLGLPTTLFALPFMGLLLPAAGIAAVLGLLPPPLSLLAVPAAALSWLLAGCMAGVVQLWAQLPLASVPVPAGELYWLALYLPVAVGGWLQRGGPKGPTADAASVRLAGNAWQGLGQHRGQVGLAGLMAAAVVVWWLALAPPPGVVVHFLAVPAGEATLIEAPAGQRALVDGGSSGPALARLLSDVLPPWERTIDLLVLTNPKPQHLTGLLEVLRRYDVRAVAESGLAGDTPEYEEWQRLLAERGLAPTLLRQGMQIALGDVALDVLHPTDGWLRNARTGVDRSDTSVVLTLQAHGQRVLLASDVRARSVLAMTDRGLLGRSAVLKLPASSGAATLGLLQDTVRPAAVVLSGSEVELSRAPAPPAEPGDQPSLLRSDLDGTVRLTIEPHGTRLRGSQPRPN